MGDISDIYAISNSMDIQELRRQQNAQLRLSEFRERADALARQTGQTVLGFFAFEQKDPTPARRNSWAPWVLGAAGVLLGLTVVASAAVIVAASVGFGLAGFGLGYLMHEPEGARMNHALDRYETYLGKSEAVAYSQARGPVQSQDGPALRTDHAASVLEERAQATGQSQSR